MSATLYEALTAAGIETSNWQSDLYFPSTPESRAILANFPREKAIASGFTSNADRRLMIEVPFAFDPYWERRAPIHHQPQEQQQ